MNLDPSSKYSLDHRMPRKSTRKMTQQGTSHARPTGSREASGPQHHDKLTLLDLSKIVLRTRACCASLAYTALDDSVQESGSSLSGLQHWKPVGRLDMPTEGLILVTNDGEYARQMELPLNQLHRTYRVRAHGIVSEHKLSRIQNGVTVDGIRYTICANESAH